MISIDKGHAVILKNKTHTHTRTHARTLERERERETEREDRERDRDLPLHGFLPLLNGFLIILRSLIQPCPTWSDAN